MINIFKKKNKKKKLENSLVIFKILILFIPPRTEMIDHYVSQIYKLLTSKIHMNSCGREVENDDKH